MHENPIQLNRDKRQSEIDFLRGLAVFLVLMRHYQYIPFLQNVGWIGVDLFFVISGFLISGLLFKEYKTTGTIKPLQFLIRRGFKIYPLFYLFLLTGILWKYYHAENISILGLSGEIFFLQNYLGHLWNHTWSLAVEEHFYLLLAAGLYITSIKYKTDDTRLFNFLFIGIATACLILRLVNNYDNLSNENLIYTHLRIDSLFAGVWLSHWYNFKFEKLKEFARNNKLILIFIFLTGMSFIPFLDIKNSYFIRTLGFTWIFTGFAALLLFALFTDIQRYVNRFYISSCLYKFTCTLGLYSYSIYIIHTHTSALVKNWRINYNLSENTSFLIYFAGTFAAGLLLSKMIEFPVLQIRDKLFPKIVTDSKVLN